MYLPFGYFLQRGWLSSDKGVSRVLIPLSEDNLSDKIIFNNNTGYLILMLGAVGYSPVVSPHRIKQVCQPYQVVKVATECGLLARSTIWVWCRGKTVMIPLYFRLCYVFSCSSKSKELSCSLLLCQHIDESLCTDIKASVTKRICQVNTISFPRKKALTWHKYIQKA